MRTGSEAQCLWPMGQEGANVFDAFGGDGWPILGFLPWIIMKRNVFLHGKIGHRGVRTGYSCK